MNKDGKQGMFPSETYTWVDEVQTAKSLGFIETFAHITPSETDLFIDYSTENPGIYFAPSDVGLWNNYYYGHADSYYGSGESSTLLINQDGSNFVLEDYLTPVAIEAINELHKFNDEIEIGDQVLLSYDTDYDELVGHLFDEDGYFKSYLGSPEHKYSQNYAENLFALDINRDGVRASLDDFNIEINIIQSSFDWVGIEENEYLPYINEAVLLWESIIDTGLPIVAGGDIYGNYGDAVESLDGFTYSYGTLIDDLLIHFDSRDYYSEGYGEGILGEGGPVEIRFTNYYEAGLPSQGYITTGTEVFDADIDRTSFYAHEIAHVLGFGTLWYNPYTDDSLLGAWNQYGKGDLIDEYGDYVGEYALETFSEQTGFIEEYIPVERWRSRNSWCTLGRRSLFI